MIKVHYTALQRMQKNKQKKIIKNSGLLKVRNDCPMTAAALALYSLMLTYSLDTTNRDMPVISSMLLMLL